MIQFRSQNFQRYFFNTTWIVAEKVIRTVVVVMVVAYVARYLGPDGFGLLSFAMSFVGLFSIFATLGVDQILVRNLAQPHRSREKLMGSALTLRLFGGLLALAFVFSALHVTSSDKTTKTLVLIIALGNIFQAFNVIDYYFQSQVLSRFTSLAQICTTFIGSAARLSLIALKASIFWFAWITVLESITLAIFLLFMYRRLKLDAFAWSFDKYISIELLRDAWPLMLAGAAVAVYMRIDQVMIKEMLDSEAVGNYAAAVRFSEAWYFIPVAVCGSLFPAIITAKSKSKEEYHDKLQKLYSLIVLLAFMIALPTTLLADPIVFFLFGSQFHQTAAVIKIHVWTGVFYFLGVASSKWFLAENLQRYSFYRNLAGAITNIFLNLILIPTFGITGAALATLISLFVAAYLTMGFFRNTKDNFMLATKSFNPLSAYKTIRSLSHYLRSPDRSSI